jgi:hypothetical protein
MRDAVGLLVRSTRCYRPMAFQEDTEIDDQGRVPFDVHFSRAECIVARARHPDVLVGHHQRLADGVDRNGERARTLLQVQRADA